MNGTDPNGNDVVAIYPMLENNLCRDEYRGAGLLFPGEDPADIYRLLDGAVVRKIV